MEKGGGVNLLTERFVSRRCCRVCLCVGGGYSISIWCWGYRGVALCGRIELGETAAPWNQHFFVARFNSTFCVLLYGRIKCILSPEEGWRWSSIALGTIPSLWHYRCSMTTGLRGDEVCNSRVDLYGVWTEIVKKMCVAIDKFCVDMVAVHMVIQVTCAC